MSATQGVAAIFIAVLCAAAIGALLSETLGYALARAVNRDPAEIKATFIWCAALTPIVCAALSLWLASAVVQSKIRRFAMWMFITTSLICTAILFASYDAPKTAGIPIIDYELMIPAAIRADGVGSIDLTIWNGKNGQGCYIRDITTRGARRLIAGSMTLSPDNHDPFLSIAFHDGERWASGASGSFATTRATRSSRRSGLGTRSASASRCAVFQCRRVASKYAIG